MPHVVEEDDNQESNPYFAPGYDRQTLMDILKMAESHLTTTEIDNPDSPSIQGYQATINMVSQALIFKKR